jgi:hypothetical protein
LCIDRECKSWVEDDAGNSWRVLRKATRGKKRVIGAYGSGSDKHSSGFGT